MPVPPILQDRTIAVVVLSLGFSQIVRILSRVLPIREEDANRLHPVNINLGDIHRFHHRRHTFRYTDDKGINTMKRITNLCLAACLMTTVLAVGCQSPGMITRGQSPAPFPNAALPEVVEEQAKSQADQKIVQVAHQSPHEKKQAVMDAVHDIYQEKHNTSVTYSSEVQYAGPGNSCPTGNCPPGGYGYQGNYGGGGYCPQGNYPHGGCPTGNCGYGNDLNHYPTHHFSQSYHVPNDLSYPAQNSVGGAVVYPYYTHKGPSDFFRKK